jgi:hypothetical protein
MEYVASIFIIMVHIYSIVIFSYFLLQVLEMPCFSMSISLIISNFDSQEMLVNKVFEQLFMFKKEIIPMNNSMKYMYSSPFLLKSTMEINV